MKRDSSGGEAAAEVDALIDDFDEDVRQMVEAVGAAGGQSQREHGYLCQRAADHN